MARNNRRQRRRRRQTQQLELLTGAPVALPADTRAVREYLRLQAWNREANATNCKRNTKHGLRSRFAIHMDGKPTASPVPTYSQLHHDVADFIGVRDASETTRYANDGVDLKITYM